MDNTTLSMTFKVDTDTTYNDYVKTINNNNNNSNNSNSNSNNSNNNNIYHNYTFKYPALMKEIVDSNFCIFTCKTLFETQTKLLNNDSYNFDENYFNDILKLLIIHKDTFKILPIKQNISTVNQITSNESIDQVTRKVQNVNVFTPTPYSDTLHMFILIFCRKISQYNNNTILLQNLLKMVMIEFDYDIYRVMLCLRHLDQNMISILINVLTTIVTDTKNHKDYKTIINTCFATLLKIITNNNLKTNVGDIKFINDDNKHLIDREILLDVLNCNTNYNILACDLILYFIDNFLKQDLFTCLTLPFVLVNEKHEITIVAAFIKTLQYDSNELFYIFELLKTDMISNNKLALFKNFNLNEYFNDNEIIQLLQTFTIKEEKFKTEYIKYLGSTSEYKKAFSIILEDFTIINKYFTNVIPIYMYLLDYKIKYDIVNKSDIYTIIPLVQNDDKLTILRKINKTNMFTYQEIVGLLGTYDIPKTLINQFLNVQTCSYDDLLFAIQGIEPYEVYNLISKSQLLRSTATMIVSIINLVPLLTTNTKIDNFIDRYLYKIKIIEKCALSKFDSHDGLNLLLSVFDDKNIDTVQKHTYKKYILEFLANNGNDKKILKKCVITMISSKIGRYEMTRNNIYEAYINIPNFIDNFRILEKPVQVENNIYYNILNNSIEKCIHVINDKNKLQQIREKAITLKIRELQCSLNSTMPNTIIKKKDTNINKVKKTIVNNNDNKDITETTECIICCENKRNAAFSCGHVVYCVDCAAKFFANSRTGYCQCPVCRANVNEYIKIYI